MLKINEKAPDFKLKNKEGVFYSLKDFNSDFLIIYFYPRDNTPGCSIEASEFSEDLNEFRKLNAKIVGISGGDEESKKKFSEKYDLRVLLLSDHDFSTCKRYSVYGEKKFIGNEFLGINRVTFVLDKDKKIIRIFEKDNTRGHSQEVLEFLRNES